MTLVQLEKRNNIYILTLSNTTNDNWFTIDFIKELNDKLNEILKSWNGSDSTALITTSSNNKIYSNGLALEQAFEKGHDYFVLYMRLLYKLLVFPIPTIAGINGHAFAGGCMFALAHDYRVMRSDRGFICLNEVDIPSALTPGMMALIRSKVPHSILFRDMILQGKRVAAKEALDYGLVDVITPDHDSVLIEAIALANKWAPKAKAGKNYGYLKQEMYIDAYEHLQRAKLGLVGVSTGIPETSKL